MSFLLFYIMAILGSTDMFWESPFPHTLATEVPLQVRNTEAVQALFRIQYYLKGQLHSRTSSKCTFDSCFKKDIW